MPSTLPWLRFGQLEMLCAIADTGGVRAAAARVHLSPPAVSKALREIERALRFPLFERRSRGLAPTPRGQRVIAHARLLLNELVYMIEDTGGAPGPVALIRLGASSYVSTHVLPPLLAALRDGDGDAIRITIHEGRLGGLLEDLLSGRIDALVTPFVPDDVAGVDTATITVEPLRDEPIAIVAPAALARRVARVRSDWNALAALPWVLPAEPLQLRRLVDTAFRARGAQPPLPVVESASFTANARLCERGLGLTIVPRAVAADAIADGRLMDVPVTLPLPRARLALVYRHASARYLHAIGRLREAAHATLGDGAAPRGADAA